MKQIILLAGLIFIMTACTVASSSNANDEIQRSVLGTFVAETIEAEHVKITASAQVVTTSPTQLSGPESLATVTLIPVMTTTQVVPTMAPIPTKTLLIYPALPLVATAVPLSANYWQLLTNIPQKAVPGEDMYVKIQTTPNIDCVLSYIGPGWGGDDSFEYHKTADVNGYCEWSWQILPDSIGEVVNITIDVKGNSKMYEVRIDGPTPTLNG